MEDGLDDLPALEGDLPQLLDEKSIAAEELTRDARDTPPRQTPVIQSAPRAERRSSAAQRRAAHRSSPFAALHCCCTAVHCCCCCRSVHCGCYLGRMLDMKLIARRLWNAVFDPRVRALRLPALCVRPTPSSSSYSSSSPLCCSPCSAAAAAAASVCAQRSQNGVMVSLRRPRMSVLVFPSGKVIAMGARSEASAILGCRMVARMIQRQDGHSGVRLSDFRTHNVTASGCLGFRVDLRALSRHPAHEDAIEYNPDQFPGLHYKLTDDAAPPTPPSPVKAEVKPEPGAAPFPWLQPPAPAAARGAAAGGGRGGGEGPLTMTLYFSGRFTLVGARHETEVYRVCARASRMLWPFRQRGEGTGESVAYDAWLARAEDDERRRGRLGWEDEAERVREALRKRERRRAQSLDDAHRREERKEPVPDVRVKPEPGLPAPPLPPPVPEEKTAQTRAEVEAEVREKATDRMETGEEKRREEGEPIGGSGAVVTDAGLSTHAEGNDDDGQVEWE